ALVAKRMAQDGVAAVLDVAGPVGARHGSVLPELGADQPRQLAAIVARPSAESLARRLIRRSWRTVKTASSALMQPARPAEMPINLTQVFSVIVLPGSQSKVRSGAKARATSRRRSRCHAGPRHRWVHVGSRYV